MTYKPRILFVDDNVNLLSAIRRVSRGKADLVTAESAADALQMLAKDNAIAVVISDQNMPNMKGVDFLAEVAQRWPSVVRVMQTGNNDQETAISAINSGQVFRFVRKPYEPKKLMQIIDESVRYHHTLKAEEYLLETTVAGTVKLLTELLALLRPGLFNQAIAVHAIGKLLAKEFALPKAWEFDIASLLYPLGLVTLSVALQNRLDNGFKLTDAEKIEVDQSAEVAASFLRNVPKLENVATYIEMSRYGYDGSGANSGEFMGQDLPLVSRLLRITIDLVYISSVKNVSLQVACSALQRKPAPYDPALLKKIVQLLNSDAAETIHHDVQARISQLDEKLTDLKRSGTKKKEKIIVDCRGLKVGDQVLANIVSTDGRLYLKRGLRISDVTIARISKLIATESIENKFSVLRTEQ